MKYSKTGAKSTNTAATLTVSIAAAILTACGGGGGSESGSPAPTINRSTVNITTAENSVEVRQLDGTIDADTLAPVEGYDSPAVTTVINDDTITVTVADLSNDAEERFTVTTSANTRYTVVISAANTSAQASVQQAATLTEISSAQALVSDDLRLMNAVLEIEYLAKGISDSEKITTKTAAANNIALSSSELDNQIALLDQALTDYQNGDITPLWQDSWHYLIINQLGGSGVDSASLF